MNETSLLRRVRSDIPERDPEDIARGRATLFRAIESESPFAPLAEGEGGARLPKTRVRRMRRTRRVATWAGFSALGATALTVTLVATNVLGFAEWHGGAEPAAATVLESASIAALEASDPVLSPGQYLRVQTDGIFATTGALESGEPVSFLEKYHDELFVPADRDEDWVWIQCMRTPFQTFGPESEKFAELVAESDKTYDRDQLHLLPGGKLANGGDFGGYDQHGETTVGEFDALPREPRRLLQAIYELNGSAGQSRDGQALVWIADTLRRGTVPADLRAALYQAAAQIPGVTVTEEQATLNGTTGIAIGRVEAASNIRQDIIIDPTTGQFIGERQVTLDGEASLPAGVAYAWTAVGTSVVDSAPTDVATCQTTDEAAAQ